MTKRAWATWLVNVKRGLSHLRGTWDTWPWPVKRGLSYFLKCESEPWVYLTLEYERWPGWLQCEREPGGPISRIRQGTWFLIYLTLKFEGKPGHLTPECWKASKLERVHLGFWRMGHPEQWVYISAHLYPSGGFWLGKIADFLGLLFMFVPG